MLTVQASTKPIRKRRQPRIGLAVAGGGPIGGMYELGALRAMDEAPFSYSGRSIASRK